MQGVVGISRKQCECLDYDDFPPDGTESLSGLFVDELPNLNMYFVNKAGGCTDVWYKCTEAYYDSVERLRQDIMMRVMDTRRMKWSAFGGDIGSRKFSSALIPLKSLAGVRVYCNDISDGEFVLRKIGALFSHTGTVTVYVVSLEDLTTPIAMYDVATAAGKYTVTTLSTPLHLPLSSDMYENMEYYVYYETAGLQPLNNTVGCGCGGVRWCFDTLHPCFASPDATKDAWRQYLMIGGVQADTAGDFDTVTAVNHMYGLVLNGTFGCNPTGILCTDTVDWASDPVYFAVAHALRYRIGITLIEYVLTSAEINRFTMMNREGMALIADGYEARYKELLSYIGKTMDVSQSGCFECDPKLWIGKAGILT